MKVLAETPRFDFVEFQGKVGLKAKTTSVAVLPYTVNAVGIVEKLGILQEWNELRPDNYAETLITGTIEDSDEDAYTTAVRELREEGGIEMDPFENNKWLFLGNFHDSKDSDKVFPTFAVDVTGKEVGTPATDGSYGETNSSFSLKDVNEVLATSKETMVLASFLRLFNIMYQKSFAHAK